MKSKTIWTLVAGAVATVGLQSAVSRESLGLVLKGPVESIDRTAKTVTVLGQRISVPSTGELAVGSVVNVYGRLETTGRISSVAVEDLALNASGADALYLKGVVTAVFAETGHARVGGTDVDYTALLSTSSFRVPVAGEIAEFRGTVPRTGGVFLAAAVIGTGQAQAVIGTGQAKAVIGTGQAQAVIGTGQAQAVIGTGQAKAVIGTGQAQAVIGTGQAKAVIGTGQAQAVIGTGQAQAVIGTGQAQAVIGTGQAQAVIGTGQTKAVIGTGQAQAVIGTGQAQAVIGTGQAQAVIGTGQAKAVIGTGHTFAVIGTGST